MDLAECVTWLFLSATSHLKLSLNVFQTFVKMLKFCLLQQILSHIPRVQKQGPRPTALAFPYPRPGQKPAQAKGWAWLGLASGLRLEPAHHYCHLPLIISTSYALTCTLLLTIIHICYKVMGSS
jgi:hypothetical protein